MNSKVKKEEEIQDNFKQINSILVVKNKLEIRPPLIIVQSMDNNNQSNPNLKSQQDLIVKKIPKILYKILTTAILNKI